MPSVRNSPWPARRRCAPAFCRFDIAVASTSRAAGRAAFPSQAASRAAGLQGLGFAAVAWRSAQLRQCPAVADALLLPLLRSCEDQEDEARDQVQGSLQQVLVHAVRDGFGQGRQVEAVVASWYDRCRVKRQCVVVLLSLACSRPPASGLTVNDI
jgi:hypothetical protein